MTTAYGQHRQPGAAQHHLHVVLVHADRGREHPGADVADAGHLEQPLERAVLAERAVQQREHDVDLAERARHRRPARGPRARCRLVLLGERDRGAGGVDLGQLVAGGDREPVRVVGLEHPAAVGVMPTGTTSYRSGSMACSTLPAVTQEIACSLERPPKTTATRGLRVGGVRLVLAHGAPTLPVPTALPGTRTWLAACPPTQPDPAARRTVPPPSP